MLSPFCKGVLPMKKWLILTSILALAACGGHEGLSKSDVQKAVNASAKNHSVCIPFALTVEHRREGENPALTQLGAGEIKLLKRQEDGKTANPIAMQQMDILVDAGLYHQEKTERIGEGDEAIRYLVYHLTEKGKEFFVPTPQENLMCIGTEAVEKINYFTTPTPSNGITISQISYEAKIIPAKWAKKLLKDNEYFENLSRTKTKHATLVQTNEGWRDIYSLHD